MVWVLRREAVGVMRDRVEGRGSSVKRIIHPVMDIWDFPLGDGEPLKGLGTKTGGRARNVISAVSYKDNLEAFWKRLWRLSPET